MLKYSFWKTEWNEDFPSRPYVVVDMKEIWYFWDEINNLSWNDLRDIVDRLERVKLWTKNDCLFWWELCDINCRRKAEGEEYIPWKITCKLYYDYFDHKSMDIDFEDIYNLMKDWKEYIEKWEKETWLKKIWDSD